MSYPNHGLSFLVINGGCTQPKENQPISGRFVGKMITLTHFYLELLLKKNQNVPIAGKAANKRQLRHIKR